MLIVRSIFAMLLVVGLSSVLGQAAADAQSAAGGAATSFRLSATAAAPLDLSVAGKAIPFARGRGGFSLFDPAANRAVALRPGTLRQQGAQTLFTAEGDDVQLEARFTPGDGVIRAEGVVHSSRSDERPLVVRYVLPLPAEDCYFEDELSHRAKVNATDHHLGTVYPLAAMCGKTWAVALSIPPSAPCCFGMSGSGEGLGVEFYLGITPATAEFPNAARIALEIYPADPQWGFRSALARYYELHSDYYTPRIQGGGMWNWQEKGPIEHALPLFRFQGITHTGQLAEELERNRKFGLLTFDYIMVGQLELKRLPALPKDYQEAMKVVDAWAADWRAHPDGAARKDYPHWRDRELPDHIERCGCKNAEGQYYVKMRETVWGDNSLTFTMNPNPFLFTTNKKGTGTSHPSVVPPQSRIGSEPVPFSLDGPSTVGSTALKVTGEWFETLPIDGIMIDSLGAQWPAVMNHRRDHFPYARYPLSFDSQGRVALHNQISHYEFLEELRKQARAKDKLLFANGIYRYQRRGTPEFYNGVENGRFFLAALLDAAGREEISLPTREMLENYRASMGRKLFATLLYEWKNPENVRRQLNRELPFAVFATPIRSYLDKVSYLLSKEGFARDQPVLEWFVKHCRLLHDAGWQPVTYARISGDDIVCERYGGKDVVYFALVNFAAEPRKCELAIDLAPLGFSPQEGEMFGLAEIARNAPIVHSSEGDLARVRLTLEPDEAQIIKLQRRW